MAEFSLVTLREKLLLASIIWVVMLDGKQHLLLMHPLFVPSRNDSILCSRSADAFTSWLNKVERPADPLLLMACEYRWFGSSFSEVAFTVVCVVLLGSSEIRVV